MPTALNVIALISGGKDSLYSILHCLQNGHNVVALANLYPDPSTAAEPEPTDLNSHMYQTVGHSVVPLYAQALQLPLYRRPITGAATQTGRTYDPTAQGPGNEHDETEDLVPLLRDVLAQHPAANAVCSGAILSTYQRARIESVAIRLGLTPLAYLWQYPALPPPSGRGDSITGLLDDMAAAGCEARVVKVASGGLGEDSLWGDVCGAEFRKQAVRGMAVYFEGREMWLRGAVVGEGGEFETLAVGGPRAVWKGGGVEVEGWEVVMEEGGVRWVRVRGARVVGYGESEGEDVDVGEEEEEGRGKGGERRLVRVPGMFDWQFDVAMEKVRGRRNEVEDVSTNEADNIADASKSKTDPRRRDGSEHHGDAGIIPLSAISRSANSTSGPENVHELHDIYNNSTLSVTASHHLTPSIHTLQISNLTAPPNDPNTSTASSITIQTTQILTNLTKTLTSLSLSPTAIISTTLLLRTISDFASINTLYAALFPLGMPNPPTRVAIACGDSLPPGVDVSLSVILDIGGKRTRWRGLHVQGLSYWAPANIGAYSQAIAVEAAQGIEVVHMAGQIPLVPASMDLYSEGAWMIGEAGLSLQHLWRVGQERGVDVWCWGIAFLENGKINAVDVAWELWKGVHEVGTRPCLKDNEAEDDEEDDEEVGGPDAWDLKHNRRAGSGFDASKVTVGEHLHLLPNPRLQKANSTIRLHAPPLIVAEVEALPRKATMESHSLGLAGLVSHSGETKQVGWEMVTKGWGVLCVLKVMLEADSQGSDGEEEEASEDQWRKEKGCQDDTSTKAEINFVSILVFEGQSSAIDRGVEGLIPRISDLLHEIFSPQPSDISGLASARSTENQGHPAQVSMSVAHGTAYVSNPSGFSVWMAIGDIDAMTVIPCHTVWGSAGSERPQKLSVALTMRVDVKRPWAV